MRQLTVKQKNLLRKWHSEKEPSEIQRIIFGSINPLRKWMDLSLEQMEELERINDTEILPQNVDMFLRDLTMGAI